MNESFSIVNVIQSMLAPGIMISACGLLLLGMNNKYSLVVSRIRLLSEERRRFFKHAGENELQFEDEIRLKSIATQLEDLHARVRLVRNAVLFYSIAVGSFVLTSLCIGLQFATELIEMQYVALAFFGIGMINVLIGICFAGLETWKGFQIVSYEIKVHE
jgi:hypothetical protein